MIKALIFDYDGVIVDSFPTVHKVFSIICNRMDKNCPKHILGFRDAYGENSRMLLKNLGFSNKEVDKANLIYREEIKKQNPNFYPGIKEAIIKLHKKYELFLVTANLRMEAEDKLKKLGVLGCFSKIIGGSLEPIEKSGALIKLLDEKKFSGYEVVMIGDRINDYNAAEKAGIKNIILVDYGWGYDKTKIPNYKQKIKIEKPLDILRAVESFEK